MATKKKNAQKPKREKTQEVTPRQAAKYRAKITKQERIPKAAKIAFVVVAIFAMVLSLSAMACSGVLNSTKNTEGYTLTGGVAATVNGVNITEDTVTKQIMKFKSSSYDTDEKWANYLAGQDKTPESYREETIRSIARQLLISQAQREKNITVLQSEINDAWDSAAQTYGGSDKLIEFITKLGYTESSYKETLQSSIATSKLKEAVAPVEDPTDEEIVAAVNEKLDTYNNARRSSHILFKVDSDASEEETAEVQTKAQEVLDKINAGEIEFDEAAKEYSEDGSAQSGGDVGWDKLSSFVSEYQEALSALDKDQVSGLVKSQYGYHIIKCTDLFSVDGSVTSVDEIPDAIKEKVVSSLKTSKQSTAYNEWLEAYVEAADIQIKPMPENVPYNVDMSIATTSSSDESSSDSSEASGSSE